MLGIVLELLVSWILLTYFGKTDLRVLGIEPYRPRIYTLLIGFLWSTLFISGLNITIAFVTRNPYILNNAYTLQDFYKASAYVLRAVVYEELLFRGALLYLLIYYLGSRKATIISAIGFGMYHWFSWNIIGQPIPMIIVFVTTGIMGYLLAYAYVKTHSIYVPIALHLGNNFTAMVLFSKDQSIGVQLFTKTFLTDPFVPPAYISLPLLILHFIGFYILGYYWICSLTSLRLRHRLKKVRNPL